MRLTRFGLLAAMLGLLTAPTGCTTTLTPPDPASLHEPVTVYLVDQGRTASLVLPDERGGMIRYAYGNWCWYAMGKRGVLEGMAAMLLPTRGALGRKAMAGAATIGNLRGHVSADHFYPLTVERAAVARLRNRLEGIFHGNGQTLLANESVGLEFVHHPRAYCAFHNSNHAVADWLEELGVRGDGIRAFSKWGVKEARRLEVQTQPWAFRARRTQERTWRGAERIIADKIVAVVNSSFSSSGVPDDLIRTRRSGPKSRDRPAYQRQRI